MRTSGKNILKNKWIKIRKKMKQSIITSVSDLSSWNGCIFSHPPKLSYVTVPCKIEAWLLVSRMQRRNYAFHVERGFCIRFLFLLGSTVSEPYLELHTIHIGLGSEWVGKAFSLSTYLPTLVTGCCLTDCWICLCSSNNLLILPYLFLWCHWHRK